MCVCVCACVCDVCMCVCVPVHVGVGVSVCLSVSVSLSAYHSTRFTHQLMVRLMTGTWFHFNDSTVTEVSTEQVASCKAYILFYVRRTNSGNLSDTIDDFVDVET